MSFTSGTFHELIKSAEVIPFYKAGNKSNKVTFTIESNLYFLMIAAQNHDNLIVKYLKDIFWALCCLLFILTIS